MKERNFKTGIAVLVIAFLAYSVVGYLGMSLTHHSQDNGMCPLAPFLNQSCGVTDIASATGLHHLLGGKAFFQSWLSFTTILIAAVLMVLSFAVISSTGNRQVGSSWFFYFQHFKSQFRRKANKNFLRWLVRIQYESAAPI
ncbi:MAG: hypothetical protein Q8Q20_04415 [bacterium]|nr:hypothetical protein [bacterium]